MQHKHFLLVFCKKYCKGSAINNCSIIIAKCSNLPVPTVLLQKTHIWLSQQPDFLVYLFVALFFARESNFLSCYNNLQKEKCSVASKYNYLHSQDIFCCCCCGKWTFCNRRLVKFSPFTIFRSVFFCVQRHFQKEKWTLIYTATYFHNRTLYIALFVLVAHMRK